LGPCAAFLGIPHMRACLPRGPQNAPK